MSVSARTKLLLVMLAAFLVWSGWLMFSLGSKGLRLSDDAKTAEKIAGIGQALSDMREASVAVAGVSQPDSSLNRWRTLYLNYRAAVNRIDGKSPSVQRVMDILVQVYAYVARTEKIRQELMGGERPEEQARALESEFRSNINLAMAGVKEAEIKLAAAPDSIPPSQRAAVFASLGAACLLTLAAAGLLLASDRRLRRMRETEQLLNNAVARVNSVEDSIGEGVLTLDDQGLIRSANPAVERMFGYSAEELSGRHVRTLVPGAYSLPHAGGARELSGVRKDGSEFPVEFDLKRVSLEEGSLPLAFVRDVTDRICALTPLSETEKMDLAVALAGRFAHNFNNVLTSITGYADLLTYSVDEKDPLRKDLEEIKKAGDRAASLTASMLAFSGKQVLRQEDVNINPLVSKVVRGLAPLLGDRIRIEFTADAEAGSVKADPEQIEQVILKLAVNARDAMPLGGTLTVRTESRDLDTVAAARVELPAGDYVVIEIEDTGEGMDDNVRAHLFEPFFTTKEAGRGMGLGLPSSWGVVRQSGGIIRAESVPGAGSTFRVFLPQQRALPKHNSARVISALLEEKGNRRRS